MAKRKSIVCLRFDPHTESAAKLPSEETTNKRQLAKVKAMPRAFMLGGRVIPKVCIMRSGKSYINCWHRIPKPVSKPIRHSLLPRLFFSTFFHPHLQTIDCQDPTYGCTSIIQYSGSPWVRQLPRVETPVSSQWQEHSRLSGTMRKGRSILQSQPSSNDLSETSGGKFRHNQRRMS